MYLLLQFCTLIYNNSFLVVHVDGAEYGGSYVYISHAVLAVFNILPEYDTEFLELLFMKFMYFKCDNLKGSYLKVVHSVLQVFMLVFTNIECL
jgi:hypothetical protein